MKLSKISRKHLMYNGVYQILNTKSKKSYIGSCAAKDYLYTRLIHHRMLLLNGTHPNVHLQRSFNKHGLTAFEFLILDKCDSKSCVTLEQKWLDIIKPEFNVAKQAGNTKGVVFTEERKKNIQKSVKKWHDEHPEFAERMRKLYTGQKLSTQHKINIGKGLSGHIQTEQTKKKIREGVSKPVLNLVTKELYSSAKEAAKKLKCSHAYISEICNGKKQGKYNLEYVKS